MMQNQEKIAKGKKAKRWREEDAQDGEVDEKLEKGITCIICM